VLDTCCQETDAYARKSKIGHSNNEWPKKRNVKPAVVPTVKRSRCDRMRRPLDVLMAEKNVVRIMALKCALVKTLSRKRFFMIYHMHVFQ